MTATDWLLSAAFFLVAVLYASVGHAGASGYIGAMALLARWMPTRDASGTSVAFVWINSLTALAGLVHASGTLPRALPLWLVAVAVGALLGSQLGLRWLPVKGLRYALSLVLVVAAGKLLLS